jgi:hypothetical protein
MNSAMRPFVIAFALLLVPVAAGGCRSLQANAAKDPQRCERDPNCANRADRSHDCAVQCADNPSCMDRCREAAGRRW